MHKNLRKRTDLNQQYYLKYMEEKDNESQKDKFYTPVT